MSLSTLPFEKTLYGFSGTFPPQKAWETVKPLMDRLWDIIRREKLATEGINHGVYTGKGNVFVGVGLLDPITASASLEKKEIKLERYAVWNHRGDFAEIRKGYSVLQEEIMKRGEKEGAVSIEIYGHVHASEPQSEMSLLLEIQTLYDAAGGFDGLLKLAAAWHKRVLADEVVAHAFSHGFHPQHLERLASYWAEALGGPALYTTRYGTESSVVRTHSGNGVHDEMDRRAIACFDQALVDVGLAPDKDLRRVLHNYFTWATKTSMTRYHQSSKDVPEGLPLPKWSWTGLSRG